LVLYLLGNFVEANSGVGYASCFGDYQSLLSPNSVVSSGLGSFIQGEDWTYTTAVCSNWANPFAGACVAVTCDPSGSGATGGMRCNSGTTYVRIIDSLGNGCSGNPMHLFDLNNVPFNQVAYDGASCSGAFALKYSTVSCQTAGIVKGGIKIGIPPQQSSPYCPSFVFSNVGGSGAIHSVSVSTDGNTWIPFKRNSYNGARWDCPGQGNFLGNSLSFKLTSCTVDSVFQTCAPADTIVLNTVLPSSWCNGGTSACPSNSWQAGTNFQSSGGPSSQPPSNPVLPSGSSTVRCGADWTSANRACGTTCSAANPTCPSGQCYADLDASPCSNKPSTKSSTRCGAGWANANSKCGNACSIDGDCPAGEQCFASLDMTPCPSAAMSENGNTYTEASVISPAERPAWQIGLIVLAVVFVVGIAVVGSVMIFRRKKEEEKV